MHKYILIILFCFITLSCSESTNLNLDADDPNTGENDPEVINPDLNLEEENTKVEPDFRNFYGVAWSGTISDHIKYVKHMGYDYIFYMYPSKDYEKASNLKFYYCGPEYEVYREIIDRKETYSEEEKQFLSRFAALKDASKPFPENLARGWFFSPTRFRVEPDYQQQRVIDLLIEKILAKVAEIERPEIGFEFGGYAWDVPQLTGDFWDTIPNGLGRQITLKHWTGRDSGSKHPNVTHEYKTYSDGKAAFYKTLMRKTRQKYPTAKFMMEPAFPYEHYIEQIENRADASELVPDLMVQEKNGDDFITDDRLYKKGLLKHSNVGSTSPSMFTEDKNRKVAGLAASKGSYFGWFGRFGGSGDMPNYKQIWEVPSRLQLVRVIPNWENLHKVQLDKRTWDGEVYSSPTAYISKGVMYAIQPRTNKLFVVFMDANATAEIPEKYKNAKVYRTNIFFIEEGNATQDILFSGNRIQLQSKGILNRGYILNLE